MRASEYVRVLQDLISEHGDLEVVTEENEPAGEPEFSDDLDELVFVIG